MIHKFGTVKITENKVSVEGFHFEGMNWEQELIMWVVFKLIEHLRRDWCKP